MGSGSNKYSRDNAGWWNLIINKFPGRQKLSGDFYIEKVLKIFILKVEQNIWRKEESSVIIKLR